MLVEVTDLLLNGSLNSTQRFQSVPLFVFRHDTTKTALYGAVIEGHDLKGETLEAGLEAGDNVATGGVAAHSNIQLSTCISSFLFISSFPFSLDIIRLPHNYGHGGREQLYTGYESK